ncbi:MAG: hypothetical protein RL701_4770 [Pseudomonadota bacterium]|jgi:uncharacterized repeat protein (TIGR03803 family)
MRISKSSSRLFFTLSLAALAWPANAAHAQRQTLFEFGAPHGASPVALVRGGDGRLYGAAREGGAFGKGSLFAYGAHRELRVVYSFTGGADGIAPNALVAGADGLLYGLSANVENVSTRTVLFRVSRAGAFRVLQTFGDATEIVLAARPGGGVFAASRAGDIFAIDASGAQQTLFTFSGGDYASTLVAAPDGQLYGTTDTNVGTAGLFRLSKTGEFARLAGFAEPSEDSGAEAPTAIARTVGGTLYVATRLAEHGVLYRLRGDGPLTHVVDLPQAPAVLASGLLGEVYGSVTYGTPTGFGSIFRVGPDGRVTTWHEFSEEDGSSATQLASVLDGLYAITSGGGSRSGTLVRMRSPRDFTTLFTFDYPDGASPNGLVLGHDGFLYGITLSGGAHDAGTVFKASKSGTLTTLYSFGRTDGAQPSSLIQGTAGSFYGRTSSGGAHGYGTFFKLTSAGEFTTLLDFDVAGQGDGPPLVQADDTTFYEADAVGAGNILRLTTSGERAVVYSFVGRDSPDGAKPNALVAGDGSTFYGITEGAFGPLLPPFLSPGTIFQVTGDGTFETLYIFNDPAVRPNAATPRAMIRGRDGKLYGLTPTFPFLCPSGTLWGFDPQSKTFEVLHAFVGAQDASDPVTLIENQAGIIYGMTFGGPGVPGASAACPRDVRVPTLFRYSRAAGLQTLEVFPYRVADSVTGPLVRRAAKLVDGLDGKLYGIVANSAPGVSSELFAYTPPTP